MNRDKPVLDWVRRKWRAYCAVRKSAAELNPNGLLRRGLVSSREQLLRVMGQAKAPTKLLQ